MVLQKLGPHLLNASYISLSHAGEPTFSRAFWPLLRIIAKIPEDQRPVVHLMSNGKVVDAQFFRRAVQHGVRSWMFSVDGLTPESHDWLRRGSSIHELGEKIRELCSLRRQEGLKTRIGISWTVTHKNLHELSVLPDRAHEWGLDYIKLEEVCPVNPCAAELGDLPGAIFYPALKAFADRSKQLGLRFVDHTATMQVFKCRMAFDSKMVEFSNADDYANSIAINPCQAPYDTIYVEPDGTVKPRSFHHRGAGNLLELNLLDLWNGAEFQGWRRIVRNRRICQGQVTCL